MSSSFSTNLGSRDTLKRLTRCGFKPRAVQMRWIVVSLTPTTAASVRVLHWVAANGLVCVVRRTISAGSTFGLRPPRNARAASDLNPAHANQLGNLAVVQPIGRQQHDEVAIVIRHD